MEAVTGDQAGTGHAINISLGFCQLAVEVSSCLFQSQEGSSLIYQKVMQNSLLEISLPQGIVVAVFIVM